MPAGNLNNDVGDPDAGIRAAVPLRAAHALAALLLEDADLRATRLSLDDAEDLGARDERRAGDDVPRRVLEDQDLVDADLLARLGGHAVHRDHGPGSDLHLTSAA